VTKQQHACNASAGADDRGINGFHSTLLSPNCYY
jgi:hypothetical protein